MQIGGSGSFNSVYSSGTSCIGKGLLPGFDPKTIPPQFMDRVTEKGSSFCFKGPVSIQTTNDHTTVTFLADMAPLFYAKSVIACGIAGTACILGLITYMSTYDFVGKRVLPFNPSPFQTMAGHCLSAITGISVTLLTHHVAWKILDRYLFENQ